MHRQSELLDTNAAAAYIGLAPTTLTKLRCVGGSPPYFKVGRLVKYERTVLDEWLAQRKRSSTSDGVVS